MLYHLLYPLHQDFAAFNVFRYITFRAAYAALTALAMSLLLGPLVIRRLTAWRVGQQIRMEGPASHQIKAAVGDHVLQPQGNTGMVSAEGRQLFG